MTESSNETTISSIRYKENKFQNKRGANFDEYETAEIARSVLKNEDRKYFFLKLTLVLYYSYL